VLGDERLQPIRAYSGGPVPKPTAAVATFSRSCGSSAKLSEALRDGIRVR
jgi:hypothetical protein